MKSFYFPLSKVYLKFFLLLFFLLFSSSSIYYSFAQQLAFPSAYGAGAYTTGGRGGIVVHVTNLNDRGNGSFREALLMTVPRTIVFDVSGVITLSSYVQMRAINSNVTIAGQTAPEGGITIDGNRLYLTHVDNIIVRHIRFRGGITAKGLGYNMNDSFSSLGNITNQIFDHCSFSWDGDESASWYSHLTIDNVTVQRSIFGEGLKGSLFGGTLDSKMGEMSMHHSLFYNTTHRTPNVTGPKGAKIETINNVAWTISHRLIQSTGSLNWNHIGNYYDYGNKEINNGVLHMHHAVDKAPPSIFTDGNKIVAVNSNTSRGLTPVIELNTDNRKSHRYFQNAQGHIIGEQLKSNYFTNTQHPLLGNPIPVQSAEAAFQSVKSDVGCNARLNADGSVSDNKDVLDTKWLANVNSGRYVERSDNSTWKVPRIKSVSRAKNFYMSNPHIPEAFVIAHIPNGQDYNDIAPSGYTWLEEYLNGVDKKSDATNNAVNVEILPKLAEIRLSETLQLNKTVKPQNSTNQNGKWISSDEEIATVDANGLVTPVSPGSVTIIFESTMKGVEGQSEITILPYTLIANAGRDQEICEGESVTLSASGGSKYLWSTGSTSRDISVSPIENTLYTVTVYDSTGKNSDTDDVNIVVNPMPTVDAGRNVTINSGDLAILKATGATSYIWSNGETTSDISVSPSATTTYTVTGISYGCEVSDTVKVIVDDNAASEDVISAGDNQSICKRTWTTLNATGGSSYLWSTGERTRSIDVRPLETTDYSVIAYDISGKEIGSDDTRVKVNVIPNVRAGKNVTLNVGESTTLTATGASSYLWSNGARTASITVTPNSTRYYSVVGTTAEGCENSNSVLVMLRNTTYYVDKDHGIVTQSAPSGGGNSSLAKSNVNIYLDDDNNALDAKSSVKSETKNIQDEYNTLYNTQSKFLSSVNSEATEDSLHFEFLIHPNPSNGQIHIKILGLTEQSSICLYDLSGKSLYNEIINADVHQSFLKTLYLSDYEAGIYYLKLVNNKRVITKKVVLK